MGFRFIRGKAVPKAHKTTHQDAGSDEINVVGLSGELADPQPPKTHGTNHNPGGIDAVTTNIPVTQAFSDAAAEGTAAKLARSDHRHGMPSNPVPTSRARAYLTTSQLDIPHATFTKVLLDGETYDVGGNFSNYKFTAPVAGYYLIMGKIGYLYTSVVADKIYGAVIRINNIDKGQHIVSAAVASFLDVTTFNLLYLNVNDYVELFAYHEAGVNTIDIAGGVIETFLCVSAVT